MRPLTDIGFKFALILEFEKAWSGLKRKDAIAFAEDCMVVPAGTPGYDWSLNGARDLVSDYVRTHGEQP